MRLPRRVIAALFHGRIIGENLVRIIVIVAENNGTKAIDVDGIIRIAFFYFAVSRCCANSVSKTHGSRPYGSEHETLCLIGKRILVFRELFCCFVRQIPYGCSGKIHRQDKLNGKYDTKIGGKGGKIERKPRL